MLLSVLWSTMVGESFFLIPIFSLHNNEKSLWESIGDLTCPCHPTYIWWRKGIPLLVVPGGMYPATSKGPGVRALLGRFFFRIIFFHILDVLYALILHSTIDYRWTTGSTVAVGSWYCSKIKSFNTHTETYPFQPPSQVTHIFPISVPPNL